jgi:hypothetical protein
MPTHKVKGGYKWGKHGKIYPTKAQADKQGQAIYASGLKENNNIKENTLYMKNNTIKLSESEFKKLVKESIAKILKEGYYTKGYTEHGEPSDENAYIESYEYIIDSVFNGNFSQVREMISNLNDDEIEELLDYTRNELGYNDVADKIERILGREYEESMYESKLNRLVKESIRKVLNEDYDDFDGYDNDLDYDNVYDEAYQYLVSNNPKIQSWREIAMAIGFRLETVGPNDMETLKDAIQEAMMEHEQENDDNNSILISTEILDNYQAQEIAEDNNLPEEWMGAKIWFENIDVEFEKSEMPKYKRFIKHIDYIDADLYYDYGANYYFCVKK